MSISQNSSPGRFGVLTFTGSKVDGFKEKPQSHDNWVNGGFFVLSPKVLDYIADDNTSWEGAPLEKLAQEGQLSAFKHQGFWHPMDTLRDKNYLSELWDSKRAPWKIW
jgi:glucose-1-phosphate cytidylyltransferase